MRPYTCLEVCSLLGLSRTRVRQLHRAGDLVADYDSEGRLRFDRESVAQLKAAREAAASSALDAEQRRADAEFRKRRFRAKLEAEAEERRELERQQRREERQEFARELARQLAKELRQLLPLPPHQAK